MGGLSRALSREGSARAGTVGGPQAVEAATGRPITDGLSRVLEQGSAGLLSQAMPVSLGAATVRLLQAI